MAKTVEFFFDFASATSYLAYTQLPRIAAERNAEIIWRPMLLGAVFKATGNVSPVTVAAKGRWMFGDLQLWSARYGMPFNPTPHFPVNSLTALRGAVAMQMRMPLQFQHYVELMFRAIWESHRNFISRTKSQRFCARPVSTLTACWRSCPIQPSSNS